MRRSLLAGPSLLALSLVSGLPVRADEGMWTFDNLPLAQMKAKYGFAPDAKWLEHVRLSALNFGGGSGSFISKDGLVITNHHVGRGAVQQVSGPGEKDYIKLGFVARTRAEEIKCPSLTLRTLMQMENVTDKVQAAVKPGMNEKQAAEAREGALTALAEAMRKATGLEVRPIRLYQGGEHWLYAFKVHRDVRLVMAPEAQIAFFGGDPDNFTFPRHNLDFTLFRVYENDKPYNPPHFLEWGVEGVQTGDLTFVIGHPGRTQRGETFAQMKFQRDVGFPVRVAASEARRAMLLEYGKRSPEHARQVASAVFGVENGLKSTHGYWAGLRNAKAMAEIERKEKELRAKVAKDPKLQAMAGQSWAKIEVALKVMEPLTREAGFVNTRNSSGLAQALNVVRLVEESAKPADQRLKGYQKAEELEAAKRAIGRAPRDANKELDAFQFLKGLEELKSGLKAEHPFRKVVLGSQEPAAVAKALLESTKIDDPAFRTSLVEGGLTALKATTDPMIVLARKIDPFMRKLAKAQEAQQAIIAEHGARIAKARFAVFGKSQYPDATGSLRLTFGTVECYKGLGTDLQPFTTFLGLYDRALGHGPKAGNGAWTLPPRWMEKRSALNLDTFFNFSHSVDIIGGNSGSPVVNTKGQFVGVIFDGNITMLPGNFYYDGSNNRGVTLDGRAILESLNKVYEAPSLVNEILGK